MQHITLMDQHHIKRTIKRLAIQVWEQMGEVEELIVFGLNERGYATAVILTKFLEEISDQRIQLHQFHVADNGQKTPIPNCTEKAVLIIDDVIFSGKTMFNALSTICYSNEPQIIEVLSLVDRGHRKYPYYVNSQEYPFRLNSANISKLFWKTIRCRKLSYSRILN